MMSSFKLAMVYLARSNVEKCKLLKSAPSKLVKLAQHNELGGTARQHCAAFCTRFASLALNTAHSVAPF